MAGGAPRRVVHCRRAACALALLLAAAPSLALAELTVTERLMRVADCIRNAGDLKGAPREAFMSKCVAGEGGAVTAKAAGSSAPAAEPVLPGMPVTPVAPAEPAAPPAADGLPPQERILGCATASRDMRGDARAAYLKECLAGRIPTPAIDNEQTRRRAACASQARAQASDDERQAFILACMGNGGAVAPGVINAATVPRLRDEAEPRRRAACNVLARDQQGAARQAFIDACIAAPPAAAAIAPAPGARQATQLAARERLVRSKRCADEARAQAVESGQVMAYMNACMARP